MSSSEQATDNKQISSTRAESGRSLDKRASSSYLAPPRNSSQGLKPVVSAHELRSKPDKRDITPTDSVMGVSGRRDANPLQRRSTVVNRNGYGEQASSETTNYEQQQTQVREKRFLPYIQITPNTP